MKIIGSLKKNYNSLIHFSTSLQDFLLLAIRLFWGFLFFQTGFGKLQNINSVGDFFYSLGIPFPEVSAHLVAWVETIGGACLILGFASRLISIPLILTMLVALLVAHYDSTIFKDPSILLKQSPFTFLLASLIIFVFGPGKISLDYFFERLLSSKK